nr:SpoIID/LytB domain-containing protein [Fictibacillus macauensis]
MKDAKGHVVFQPKAGTETKITVKNGAFHLTNGSTHKTLKHAFTTVSSKGAYLYHNRFKYKGTLGVSFGSKGTADVINTLNIEDYLEGVVPAEISPKWHPAAIKAQIVAARTYAMKQIGKKKYDVENNVNSQVYYGVNVSAANVNKMIHGETKGEVMTYNGQLINAYFSSSAGGYTVGSEFVWGNKLPYLVAKPDPYDHSSYMEKGWGFKMSFQQLTKKLAPLHVGKIVSLKTKHVKYHRPTAIKVIGSKGSKVISGADLRKYVGYDVIRSAVFTMKRYK